MILESHTPVTGGKMFCRSADLGKGHPVVLMIHGLGESGLCFNEAFELLTAGLIVPDLLGFGRSLSDPEDVDYSCEAQANALWELMNALGVESFFIVGHSIGGDIGTIMAASDLGSRRVLGMINVEGNVTASDTFISSEAFRASRSGRFEQWLTEEFMEKKVFGEWAKESKAARRYFASLNFCEPHAFQALAEDAVMRNLPRAGKSGTEIGELFSGLSVPHIYYWGSESLAEETVHFLPGTMPHKSFAGAGHWIMVDQPTRFYESAQEFFEDPEWAVEAALRDSL